MNELAANTLGFYYTEEKTANGSIIAYRHDKAKLSESKIIYKNGIDGFFLSVDGGQTWKAGFDNNGDAVLNILYAIGIQSKWINTRGFTATDNSGKETFKIDENTGSVYIDPNTFMLGDKGIADTINGIVLDASTVFMLLSNEYQGIVTDANGNIVGDFPNCQTTITIMLGNDDVTADAVIKPTLRKGLTGEWDSETATYTVTGLSEDNCYVEFTAMYNDSTVKRRFTVCKQRYGKDGKDGSTLSPAEIWNLLLQQNTDFMYKYNGSIFIKASYIDSGNFCGWTADRENGKLYANASDFNSDSDSNSTDGLITPSAEYYTELNAKKGIIKTRIDNLFAQAGKSRNYAALSGNNIYANTVHAYNYDNDAYFKKKLTAAAAVQFRGISSGSGTDLVLTAATMNGGCFVVKKSGSSKRFKIHDSFMGEQDVEKLYNLRPVYFKYKPGYLREGDQDCERIIPGFYAELVEKYFPEAVRYDEKKRVADWDPKKLVPAMLKLIQLQKEQLDRQEERLSKIESILNIKEE